MTELHIDSQGLSTYQSCDKKYEYIHVLNRDALMQADFVNEGSVIHGIFDIYYHGLRNRLPSKEAIKPALQLLLAPDSIDFDTLSPQVTGEWLTTLGLYKSLPAETQMLIVRKLAEYAKHYEYEGFKVVDSEVGFSKELYRDSNYLFVYEGRIDLILEDRNSDLYWVDHKKQRRRDPLNHYSNQFFGYSWALGTTYGLINYIGLQTSMKPEECFIRETVNHRPDQIREWQEGAIKTCFDIIRSRANGKYHKVRSACDGKYGRCNFYEICRQTAAPVINHMLLKETKERTWTPWE